MEKKSIISEKKLLEIQQDATHNFILHIETISVRTTSTNLKLCQPKYSDSHALKMWTIKNFISKQKTSCLTFPTINHAPNSNLTASKVMFRASKLAPIWPLNPSLASKNPNNPIPQITPSTFNPPFMFLSSKYVGNVSCSYWCFGNNRVIGNSFALQSSMFLVNEICIYSFI